MAIGTTSIQGLDALFAATAGHTVVAPIGEEIAATRQQVTKTRQLFAIAWEEATAIVFLFHKIQNEDRGEQSLNVRVY